MENLNRNGADWKSGTGYHDHGEWGKAWAWEFLRRNAAYQATWDQFHALAEKARTHFNRDEVIAQSGWDGAFESDATVLEFAMNSGLPDDEFTYAYFEPLKEGGETYSEYLARIGETFSLFPMDLGLGRNWGLFGMYDPRHSNSPKWLEWPYSARLVMNGEGAKPIARHEWHDGFVLDYRQPIAPQLKVIERYATGKQKRLASKGVIDLPPAVRLRKNEYSRYLRILDALESGTNDPDEIARHIVPFKSNIYPDYQGRQTVANSIAAAIELRDGGYRRLVRLNPKRKGVSS